MKKAILVLSLLMFGSQAALAETVYVKERQSVSLRTGTTAEDAVVGRATTGTGLELLEQTDTHTRVRLADGTEGWLANTLVTREQPPVLKVRAAEAARKKAESDAAKLAATVKSLQKQLQAAEAEAEKQQSQVQAQPAPVEGEMTGDQEIGPKDVNLLWIGISFAMLIIGFVAGALWLRERTRRKLGGMHIRVS